jgi:hypothetical protein
LQSALPDLPNLTKEDKQTCIKVGDPQAMFMVDIKDICIQRPNIMPAWHDLTDYHIRASPRWKTSWASKRSSWP